MEPVLVVQLGCVTLSVGVAGLLFTVTRTVAVFVHPLDPCPVTVYVVVDNGVITSPFNTELLQV